MEVKMEYLAEHLESKIGQLNGSWISKNSSYEDNACIQLDFECQKKRYWDCLYKDTYIEIKKGKSIWLDEVRYCEILLSDTIQNNDDCKQDIITIFIVPTKDKQNIQKIYIIDTKKIIEYLRLTREWATCLLSRVQNINRSLNCQQSMTLTDLKKIADYEIINNSV
tara:strand:- start:2544 stop:3041 length:498 start_codon:yes stop_codon:yes gene_type:complete